MAVDGEIGGLNEEAVQRAFASLAVQGCVDQRSSRLPFIGGDFKLKLRINRDGAAQWAYLSESTLGDRETERCLIGLALAKSWPKPLGGDGIAESAFSIAPRKPPALLDETRLERDVARARNEVRKCRRGARGSFAVTLYVQPSGRIAAAGVAPPDEAGESAADCMADALRELQFRYGPFKPRLAKLSFQIP